MGGGYFSEAIRFLITVIFDLYILAVVLRFLLQLVRADFYNPISQLLVTVTNPPLRPLRRFIPGYRGIDLASVLLTVLLKAIEIFLVSLLIYGRIPGIAGLVILSIADVMNLVIYIFIISIFIQVIISWINPGAYNHATILLYRLTEPLLQPARRLLPPMSGLDLSPLAVFIVLQLTIILIIKPLTHLGGVMAGVLI